MKKLGPDCRPCHYCGDFNEWQECTLMMTFYDEENVYACICKGPECKALAQHIVDKCEICGLGYHNKEFKACPYCYRMCELCNRPVNVNDVDSVAVDKSTKMYFCRNRDACCQKEFL